MHSVNKKRGFTLIEMMVAVSIFSMVMLVAVGALLTIIDANRKAQAIKSVTNNLNFALESMSRTIRTGTSYHCKSGVVPIENPQDCPGGDDWLAFEKARGKPKDASDQVVYRLNTVYSNNIPHGQIERSLKGGVIDTFVPITDSQVDITRLEFRVLNSASLSASNDKQQPRVFIIIQGETGSGRSLTTFNLQTSVTQRILDF